MRYCINYQYCTIRAIYLGHLRILLHLQSNFHKLCVYSLNTIITCHTYVKESRIEELKVNLCYHLWLRPYIVLKIAHFDMILIKWYTEMNKLWKKGHGEKMMTDFRAAYFYQVDLNFSSSDASPRCYRLITLWYWRYKRQK